MNRSEEDLATYLTRAGPQPSSDVRASLGISPATLHRLRRALGDRIHVQGRARATRLSLARRIEGLRTPVPLYQVDARGHAHHWLTLQPVEPFGHGVTDVDGRDMGFFETDPRSPSRLDLPWFLQDLAPEGFLGRAWLRRHPELGFPVDLARWSGDDVLRYLAHHGSEAPGAWLVGPVAKAAFDDGLRASRPIPHEQLAEALPARADQATEQIRGSSPGGEQPKLTVSTIDGARVRHWIVKFSPRGEGVPARRWRDLLACEHHAHEVLAGHGVPSCTSHVIDGGERRFLCVERFDRVGPRGRAGLVSLRPFDRDGVAQELRQWSLVARDLVEQGILSDADGAHVGWIEAFGHAIANTDMHLGNLALRVDGLEVTGLAPVYDMLPMFYAPRHGGELPRGTWDPDARMERWPTGVREAARAFWRTVAHDPLVSDDMRAIARRHERAR